ncbi:uncharacterized protein C8Q71DRAFT_849227 [Rhodofomes roseus]|uniref:HAM1-like N-terminal domain-containing protein n=1 Tax=Rhodofomes roseus TaxID=34475 RepID=A0ABQ8KCD5_9APHY|nr:uncharacterized protein C8Q71DRAFT_849227 [Rhodofomes roseus]KAH9834962.1 hypothetical protein C8Q71DRAFT_849227 [Rhodofomes roseus]
MYEQIVTEVKDSGRGSELEAEQHAHFMHTPGLAKHVWCSNSLVHNCHSRTLQVQQCRRHSKISIFIQVPEVQDTVTGTGRVVEDPRNEVSQGTTIQTESGEQYRGDEAADIATQRANAAKERALSEAQARCEQIQQNVDDVHPDVKKSRSVGREGCDRVPEPQGLSGGDVLAAQHRRAEYVGPGRVVADHGKNSQRQVTSDDNRQAWYELRTLLERFANGASLDIITNATVRALYEDSRKDEGLRESRDGPARSMSSVAGYCLIEPVYILYGQANNRAYQVHDNGHQF